MHVNKSYFMTYQSYKPICLVMIVYFLKCSDYYGNHISLFVCLTFDNLYIKVNIKIFPYIYYSHSYINFLIDFEFYAILLRSLIKVFHY